MGVMVGKTGDAAMVVGNGSSGVTDSGGISSDAAVGVVGAVVSATVAVAGGVEVVGVSSEAQAGGGSVGGMSVASSVGSVPDDDPARVCPAFPVIAST